MRLLIFILLLSSCAKGQVAIMGRNVTPDLTPLINGNYIFVGNSYIAGYPGHTPSSTYFAGLTPFNSNGSTFANEGISSQVTQNMINNVSSQVYAHLVSGVVNVILVEEGGNDIGVNGDVTGALNRMLAYCATIKSYCNTNGFTVKIIVSTKIPRNQASLVDDAATFNTKLVAFNVATLAENLTSWDYVIRPELQGIFATYDSGGYDPDQVHPNDIGQLRYATLYKSALLTLYRP